MKLGRLCLPILLLAPPLAFSANKDMQELQRDVGLLQEQVRSMQQSQNEKFAALTVLVQQSFDAATKANTGVAVIQSNFQQNLRDQESKLVGPVVATGAKVDSMAGDFRTLQQAVSDLTGLVSKLQAQLTDLSQAIKVMQAPAAAPPSQTGGSGDASGAGSSNAAVNCMPATDLYNQGIADRQGGKFDLALQEFANYLKCYPSTDLAANAQFYIGDIHSAKGDYPAALQDFALLEEQYPQSPKMADGLYMKGMTLVRMGRRTDGATEFGDVVKRFPNTDPAKKACQQLTALGYRCSAQPSATAPKKGRKK